MKNISNNSVKNKKEIKTGKIYNLINSIKEKLKKKVNLLIKENCRLF